MKCCLDLGFHQIARQMIGELEAELPEDLSLVEPVVYAAECHGGRQRMVRRNNVRASLAVMLAP
jgi:hypothetical protein